MSDSTRKRASSLMRRAAAVLSIPIFGHLGFGPARAATPRATPQSTLQAAMPQNAPSMVPVVQITGAVAMPTALTPKSIESRFTSSIQTITYTLKGTKHTARVVPLLTVLQAAAPKVNAHIKHHELQFVVLAQGQDGYTVAFSMPELLPAIGNRAVWLALDQDGKPFSGEAGPLELLAPDDVKPARWVHGLRALTVIDEAATPPPAG